MLRRADNTEDHRKLLADLSTALLSSLNERFLLRRALAVIVPVFADGCIIRTVNEDGSLETRETIHAKPGSRRALESLEPLGGEIRVARSASPEIFPELPASSNIAGARSIILVPLLREQRCHAVMTLVRGRDRDQFDDGDLSLGIQIARRITAACENADRYQSAQKALESRDDFLSIASHEIKTPLTSLKLQLSLLRRMLKSGRSGERVIELAESSDMEIERATRLVENFLDLAKIRLGRLVIHFEKLDLSALVQEVVDRYRQQIEAAGCPVKISLEPAIEGMWDPLRLEEVLINLISNAIKYGRGHPIEIALRRSGPDEIELSVLDHGIGISKAQQARIFDRYERAVPERQFTGLGLGLYICKEIIQAHSGTIRVESEMGQGSCFRVFLPLDGRKLCEASA